MGPTSPVVLVLLLGAAVALLVALVRVRWLAVKLAAGGAALVMAMTSGLVVVNDYYGYYQTWGDAFHDFSGGTTAPDAFLGTVAARHGTTIESGSVQAVDLTGALSGVDRGGYVYLPPQYDNPSYRSVRFPMVELLPGSPGRPEDWLTVLHIARTMDKLIATRQLGPMVLVMPASNAGNRILECLDTAQVKDDTYLSIDVPADVAARYRVTVAPAERGLLGYSSGGYCAANLALRHRALFGASAALDGYFQATSEPAGQVLRSEPALLQPNSPIAVAASLPSSTYPMPSFWVTAGTGNSDDARQAQRFVSAMSHVESVHYVVSRGGGHNFYAWNAQVQPAMAWMWQQLASPELRVRFPLSGGGSSPDLVPLKLPPDFAQHRLAATEPKPTRSSTAPTPQATRPSTANPLATRSHAPSTHVPTATPRPTPTPTRS